MDNLEIKPLPLKVQKDYLVSQLNRLDNDKDPHFTKFTEYQRHKMRQMFIALLKTLDLVIAGESTKINISVNITPDSCECDSCKNEARIKEARN
jgi:hypothetical protein